MKRSFFFFFLLINITLTYSQEKLEREYRINESEVPANALEYVESNFQNAKMKWYGEENLKGEAIEAKGRMKGRLYSVKFNIKGDLEDIEQVMDFNAIPEEARKAIEKNLESRFTKFRLQKTQLQWLGKASDLSALIQGAKVSGAHTTNYEITFMGTRDGRTEFYEILADHKGEIVRESRIVQRTNQNLIY